MSKKSEQKLRSILYMLTIELASYTWLYLEAIQYTCTLYRPHGTLLFFADYTVNLVLVLVRR